MSKMNGPNACPIVGIGSSAGGLDALKSLFTGLPADTGAAFIVIQHLDPTHESLTAEILSRFTSMNVVQITDGMEVEANHVYVIPPNAYLALQGHLLVLSEPVLMHGVRMPIDSFLWSLAEQCKERAIAIILSGTGSDGALGLREVKGNGGLVMAQAPETAQYDGMPQSAISTGLVDRVCPVEDMPDHLAGYLKTPYVGEADSDEPEKTPDDKGSMASVLAILRTRTGHDFRAYKPGTLDRRIARRMSLHHISRMDDYVVFLRKNEGEAKLLFQDLLIGVTSFFRDPEAFEALDREVITPLVEARQTDEPIRVWVPGCASGEEAYSIAILLIERLETAHKHCPIQLFASDIDESGLAFGRTGIYPENIVASVSPERIKRFFTREDHSFRVSKILRETITFATQDLIGDPPFSNLDLISCRNLLIYLEPEVQRKLLALFHFALKKQACLFLGHSETTGQQQELFEPVSKKWRIYRRASQARTPALDFPIGTRKPRPTGTGMSIGISINDQIRFEEIAQRQLLKEYAPAAVLVNSRYKVLHFSGPTTRYLELPSGAPTEDLMGLVRHEMRTRMRAALRQASEEKRRITLDDVTLTRDGSRAGVKLTLTPLTLAAPSDPLLLITFEDIPEPVAPVTDLKRADADTTDESLLRQLEFELNTTREELQSNIEELESANEELQAANEEVMSVNEELQSTNEELETSKEELQSMNEELTTTNNQLKDKVEELAEANDDLDNLLSSTVAIATTERDVTERKHVLQKLRQAKVEAELAYAAKSRFLATASHDLRQPLQSLNLLNAALFKSTDEPQMRKMIALQSESLDSMSRLLNSLLDISKLDSGTITPAMGNVAVNDVFDHLKAEFEPEAHKRRLDLIIEPTTDIALTDLSLLAQLLQNLLANALKFTRQGSIHVRCTREGDAARIEVIDTGVGIPEEHLRHIFDEFHQVNRDPQQRHGGLGLGLSIVQRIAKLLGTGVTVASEVNRGSTFSITLPIGQSGSTDEVEPKVTDKDGIALSGQILLVEDDPAVLDASIMFLSMEKGLDILSASSPSEAYERLKSSSPDVIVTDYHLNHAESGIDIVRAARKSAGRMIPAILITGDTSSAVKDFKLEGMQVMSKPVKPSDLVQSILKLLQKS